MLTRGHPKYVSYFLILFSAILKLSLIVLKLSLVHNKENKSSNLGNDKYIYIYINRNW